MVTSDDWRRAMPDVGDVLGATLILSGMMVFLAMLILDSYRTLTWKTWAMLVFVAVALALMGQTECRESHLPW